MKTLPIAIVLTALMLSSRAFACQDAARLLDAVNRADDAVRSGELRAAIAGCYAQVQPSIIDNERSVAVKERFYFEYFQAAQTVALQLWGSRSSEAAQFLESAVRIGASYSDFYAQLDDANVATLARAGQDRIGNVMLHLGQLEIARSDWDGLLNIYEQADPQALSTTSLDLWERALVHCGRRTLDKPLRALTPAELRTLKNNISDECRDHWNNYLEFLASVKKDAPKFQNVARERLARAKLILASA